MNYLSVLDVHSYIVMDFDLWPMYSGLQKYWPPTNNATFRWIIDYVETVFSKWTFLFITEEIKLNTVKIEGGYMSGIPVKHVQIKLHWV